MADISASSNEVISAVRVRAKNNRSSTNDIQPLRRDGTDGGRDGPQLNRELIFDQGTRNCETIGALVRMNECYFGDLKSILMDDDIVEVLCFICL